MHLRLLPVLVVLLLAAPGASAELRGHGGPVRALAVMPGGAVAVSGSFDQSAIVWDLDRGAATAVLRFHEGAVNAVLALPDGGFATGGEDGRIAVWRPDAAEPARIIGGHAGPIAALRLSPDKGRIASASWDGTARVTALDRDGAERLAGHQGPVNAVAFAADGRAVTGGYDGTVRFWPGAGGDPTIVTLPSPVNAIEPSPDGSLTAGCADGIARVLAPSGEMLREIDLQAGPILAIGSSPDGARLAIASIGGSVAILDRPGGRVVMRLVGPGLPVWSLAFLPDGSELLTGGSDRLVRRWNAVTGEHIGPVVLTRPEDLTPAAGSDRGAEVFKACAACHALTPEGGNRAGPTLHGIFGRRIATLAGYNFSPALKALDIVWTAGTIDRLFAIGPSHFTPGTKMPEQIVAAEDRAALIRYLETATR